MIRQALQRAGLDVAKASRWARAFDVAVLLFAMVGMGQLFLWVDYRPPVKILRRDMQTPIVEAGGEFRYTNYFVRSKFCETTVRRWFVGADSVIRVIDPLPSAMPTEGLNLPQRSEARIMVPPDLPPGPTRSCFQSTWVCNPIHRIVPIRGPETCFPFIVAEPDPFSLMAAPAWVARIEGEP